MTLDDQRLGMERRTVLKGLTMAGIGAGGLTTFSGSAIAQSCDRVVDDDGGEDHTSIQAAVDAASSGETICVNPGTYTEEVTIDKEVTVVGTSPPEDDEGATVDGWIEVTATGAAVKRLKVTSSTTYTPSNWTRPGSPFAILVTASDVLLEGNVVEGIAADAGADPTESISLNGIQLFNGGASPLTGLEVSNNTVRDMFNDGGSSWPNYGGVAAIKVQGVLDGVDVLRNRVEQLHSAGWVWGIVNTHTGNAPSVSPKNVTVERNHVSEGNDGSEFDVFDDVSSAPYPGVAFGIDGNSDADEATVRFNDFVEIPGGVQNKDEVKTLVAEVNYWGSESGPSLNVDDDEDERSAVVGPGSTDYTPWLREEVEETLGFTIEDEEDEDEDDDDEDEEEEDD